jgi:citrate lyase subunit beta/citryl-CoA lyase
MTVNIRPRRSALYLPAANARAIDKARELDCDVVILDLEDAVAPDAKVLARDQAVAAVRAGGFGRREVVIRVNGLETPWGREDLAAASSVTPDAVLAPKVSSSADVAAYRSALDGETPLWAMIETCAAAFRLDTIAAASSQHGVSTWVIGTNDLAKEMRCRLDIGRGPLLTTLSLAITAARTAQLTILDGVFNELEDDAGLAQQCEQGVAFGFDGKTLIHPRQIAIANRAFLPSDEAVAWARTVVAAFDLPENSSKGVLRLDGRMVERLHLDEARRTIAIAAAVGG